MESVRDLLVDIGIHADTSPIAETQRHLRELQRQIGGYERTQTSANNNIIRSNQRLIDETQVVNRQLGAQSDVIRQLAQTAGGSARHMADSWNSMSGDMRRSLVQNHNNLDKYRRVLADVEGDVFKLSTQMGHYSGTTNDFMQDIRKLGKEHKKASDQMINSNLAMRQGFIQQIATMSAMSGQSDKIIKNYDRMGNVMLSVNKPFLSITSGMERMAREANAANLALQMLGPNASMKDLADQIALINQGVMRQQMVLMFAAAAWIAFTAVVANAALGPDPAEVKAEQDLINKIYKDALADRISEIKLFASIFQDVATPKIDPDQLSKNLQEQVVIIRNWSSNLKTLAGRGVSDAMMAELQKMGPSAASEIQAMTQMTQPQLDQYVKDFHQRYKLITKQATSELANLKKETDKQIKDLEDSLMPLGVAWENFKGTWTKAVAPFVEFWGQIAATIVNVGTKVGEFVQRLNEISPWFTRIGGMFIYLASTALLMLTPLAAGIGWVMGLKAAFASIMLVIGPLVQGLGAMMGTVLLVSGVVLGLGVAFYLLWTRSDKFKEGVINGWNTIKSSAVSVFGFIKPYIMQALDTIVTFGKQKLDQLRAFWDENGTQILQAGKNVWTVISTVIGTVLGVIWKVMKFVWPAVLLLIKSVWGNIKGVIDGALKVIMGIVKIFTGLFTLDFKLMWAGIKQVFFGAIQFVWNYINLLMFGRILSAGKLFIQGFKGVFVGMWTGIRSAFTTSVNVVKSTVSDGFTAMKWIGESIMKGFKNAINGVWLAIHGNFMGMLSRIKLAVKTAWGTMREETKIIFGLFKSDIGKVWEGIVKGAKDLPKRIGAGIKSASGDVTAGVKALGTDIFKGIKKIIDGVTDGVKWVLGKLGAESIMGEWKIPQYANGTNYHPGGPAVLGDGRGSNAGPELYRTPRGDMGLSPSTNTIMNLPKGTQVLSATNTRKVLGSIPAYNQGNTTVGNFMSGAGNAIKNTASGAWDGIKDAAGKVKDIGVDVFSYFGNPSGLLDKVWSGLGVVFPQMKGVFKDVGSGALKMIKDAAVNFVGGKLLSSGGYTSGMEKDPHKVGRGAGMGGMMKYVEYWYNQVKDRFGPTRFMGGFADRGVVGNSNVKSMHAYGRAFDIGGSHETMSKIAEFMRQVKDIQYVIYNRRISSSGGAWRPYTGLNPHTDHVHADFKGVQMPAEQAHSGAIPNVTGGAAAWRPAIIQAAQRMNEAVTPAQVQGIIAQIDRESKGNQRIFQSPAVNDINMRNGTPARGLLQYIPSTFKNYMVKGHSNILSGIDQLMAFFNNTNWRRDLPYGKRGWGPTGARKYANGGIVTRAHMGLVGEAGPEAIIPLSAARRARGLSLLSKSASAMGVGITAGDHLPAESYSPTNSAGSRNITLTYSPEINITVPAGGNVSESIKQQVESQLEAHYKKLQALLLNPEGV
ncbi:hypothetical protein [Domibacillus aminovorans]|uniref:ARB-07466-like C-terminal domain-containing protein n=1 Tax=Domibacillus aminovorans TaxID=29332 RepID=A0A177L900_9BACI|nr:hypothetical protein [Domibacillus aminovorans]OAH61954.1 hypothetical protein AWH49_11060 [Domibacillus aminovorans]